ncbi:MAG: hypothetical protein EZS28_002596 [Streblomastix strix]|uniref:Uncharacterized protein n=1 Tax=Streblomastix strix TaxID=222440 RepID=A0A5J4X3T8_9EUKA|nr:MAG: hypothetical protein EZS28_002596 [Streblomastix strix]
MYLLFELQPSNTTEFIAIQLEKIDINWHEILTAMERKSSGQNNQNDQRWLFVLKRLQRIIITDVQDLLLINDIIDRYEIVPTELALQRVNPLADPLKIPEVQN